MRLVFALHAHQPLGNLVPVLEEAADTVYRPLLELIGAHPHVRVDLHVSGPLLRWWREHRPALLDLARELGDQVEWLGGPFYEPILPVWPASDRRRQLEMLSAFLKAELGVRPTGGWLPERVWEPDLAADLASAGLRFTYLDDNLFLAGGWDPVPSIVDHQGHTIVALPISERLRFSIPSRPVEDVVDALVELHRRDADAVRVFADDAEKFGLWPDPERSDPLTWLDRFFDLTAAHPQIRFTHGSEVADAGPHPLAQPVEGAYRELMTWALPPEARAEFEAEAHRAGTVSRPRFTRGAPWRNFLVRYPEANVAYRKVIALRRRVDAGARTSEDGERARLAAQANDAYWHGWFGGIYLPHLRRPIHEAAIDARVDLDRHGHRTRSWTELETIDWDGDGVAETHVELPDLSFVVDPADGALAYLDVKSPRWALSDVVARWDEGDAIAGPVDTRPLRWLVAAHRADDDPAGLRFAVEDNVGSGAELLEVERGRSSVSFALASERVRLDAEVEGTRMRLRYRFDDLPRGRFGPELPVAVWEEAGSIRVDGGPWQDVVTGRRLSGHRFRLRHEGVGAELVIAAASPIDVTLVPIVTRLLTDTGTEDVFQGVVLWPHRTVEGAGSLDLEIHVMPLSVPPGSERSEGPDDESEEDGHPPAETEAGGAEHDDATHTITEEDLP